MNRFSGPWADTAEEAEQIAIAAVGIDEGNYIRVEYSDSSRLDPHDPERMSILIDTAYSNNKEQYRTVLTRMHWGMR